MTEIYDPTCGNGGLLSVFGDEVEKYGQDINAAQVEEAQAHLPSFHGAVGDTLAAPAFIDRRFKYIIANPPFSIKWEQADSEIFADWPTVKGKKALPSKGKADYAFIAHILHLLADDGTAVTLGFPGILYRGNAEGTIRQWLVERNCIDTVVSVDGGKFVDTAIATCVLVFKKHRDTTDIRFIHNEHERVVPQAEVAANNYNLSVNTYINETPPREEIDPHELEILSRSASLKRIEADLKVSRLICQLEGWNMTDYLNDIRRILDKFEQEVEHEQGLPELRQDV